MSAPARVDRFDSGDFALMPKVAPLTLFLAFIVAIYGAGTTWPAAVLEGWYIAMFGALVGLAFASPSAGGPAARLIEY